MALKDWKKVKENKYVEKKPTKYNFPRHISIFKDKKYTMHGYRITVLHVTLGGTSIDESKFFKTKTQALKYAKAYMRKH